MIEETAHVIGKSQSTSEEGRGQMREERDRERERDEGGRVGWRGGRRWDR